MSAYITQVSKLIRQSEEFDRLEPRAISRFLKENLPTPQRIDELSKLIFDGTEQLCGDNQLFLGRSPDIFFVTEFGTPAEQMAKIRDLSWKEANRKVRNAVENQVRQEGIGSGSSRAVQLLTAEKLKSIAESAVQYSLHERRAVRDLCLYIQSKDLETVVTQKIAEEVKKEDPGCLPIDSAEIMMFNLIFSQLHELSVPNEEEMTQKDCEKVLKLLELMDQFATRLGVGQEEILLVVKSVMVRLGAERFRHSGDVLMEDISEVAKSPFQFALPVHDILSTTVNQCRNLTSTGFAFDPSQINPKGLSTYDRFSWKLVILLVDVLRAVQETDYFGGQKTFFQQFDQFKDSEKPRESIPLTEAEIEKLQEDCKGPRPFLKKKKKKKGAAPPKRQIELDGGSSSSSREKKIEAPQLSEMERKLNAFMAQSFPFATRVKRWFRIKNLEEIKDFTDRGVKSYTSLSSEEDLERVKRLHTFPPIERVYFDEELKKTYCKELDNGFKMVGFMEWSGRKVWGTIEIALDGKKVIHRYFKPTNEKRISFEGLLSGEFTTQGDSFDKELEKNEILFSDAVVKMSDQKILSVQHEGCSVFALPLLLTQVI